MKQKAILKTANRTAKYGSLFRVSQNVRPFYRISLGISLLVFISFCET